MIRTDQVCRYFRDGSPNELRAVDDVSISIGKGQFAVLTGPSGCGKTTLLSMIGAMMRPTSGIVTLAGQSLHECSDVELARARRQIGFVFQSDSLLPRLSLWENVSYPLVPRGVSRPDRFRKAGEVLGRMQLSTRLNARPEHLSGGEKQRAVIARALIVDPTIVLADEPTSNLDRTTAENVLAVLQELHTCGATIVVATHDEELTRVSTVEFVMREGRVECA